MTSKRIAFARNLMAGACALTLAAACESKEEQAIKFAASGQEYLEQGDLEKAVLQFNNALYKDPVNVDALRGAAEIAERQDQPIRQGRMLRRLLEEVPNDTPANLAFARLALLGGDGDRALTHAERVLAQDPADTEALTIKGAVLVVENRTEEATELLNRALAQDPGNAEIFNLLAAGDIRADDYEAALETINEGIAAADDPETLLIVKLILAERIEGDQAVIDTFEDLIETAPENGLYRQRLADFVLLKQRDFARARDLYAQALPLVTDPVPVYTRIVAIDRETQGDEAAERTLRGFIDAAPDDTDLRFTLPVFYCQTGRPDRCRQEFERLAADETLPEEERLRARIGLSDSALAAGDLEQGEALADAVLAIDDQNVQALTNKAQVLLTREESERAIELLRTALNAEPENAEAMMLLALAFEQSGQVQYADQQFAQTVDQVGYTKSVSDQYRAFLGRRGEGRRAREVLERYAQANPSDTDAVLTLAQDDIGQGDARRALQTLDRLEAAGIASERVKRLRIAALAAEGDVEDALAVSTELLAERPDDRRVIANHTRLLTEADRGDEALAMLAERVGREDAAVGDYVLHAEGLLRAERLDQAEATAREGLTRFADSEDLHIVAYLAQKRGGDEAGALETLAAGTEAARTPARALTLLSNDLIVAGRTDEAIAALRRLQEMDALQALTANNLASLLLERDGGEAEALEIAERFEDTENPFFADTLAWAYYKNDRIPEASRLSRQAADGAPNNADILYHRGVIARAEGDMPSARSALEAAKRAKAGAGASAQVSADEIDAMLAGM